VVVGGGIRGNGRRLFAGEVAAGVEGVDADIEDGAAAGEFPVGAPLAACDVEAEGAVDGLDLAEGSSPVR